MEGTEVEAEVASESEGDNAEDFNLRDMKRKPRSSGGERNYVCGCQKAYLSYPALYTHVRNKHGGTFPEGSLQRRKVKNAQEPDVVSC